MPSIGIGQNFALPGGNVTVNNANATQTGLIDKDRMLDRAVVFSVATGVSTPMTGMCTRFRVGGQNLLQSDAAAGFPIEMLSALSSDDGAYIGCPLKGGLSAEGVFALDAAADTGLCIFTSDLPAEVSATPTEDDYNWIFPLGDTGPVGIGATWTLTAIARRNVTLGRLVIVTVSAAGAYVGDGVFVNSINIAGSEVLSGAGQIPCYGAPSDNINPFGPTCNDDDGLRVDLAVEAGEAVTLTGLATGAVGVGIRAGIFLED